MQNEEDHDRGSSLAAPKAVLAENHTNPLRFIYRSERLGVNNAMFTRRDGYSAHPYDSLNLSFHVGDIPDNVRRNREAVKKHLRIHSLVSARQVHGDRVELVKNVTGDTEIPECDALITKRNGVGLLIQQADCQAVLLHDPCRKAIAAIHCGWRGSVTNIIRKTIEQLIEHFETRPEHLKAVISPSLGPCCSEFVNYREELPSYFLPYQEGEKHFNFWKISGDQLVETGVLKENIEIIGQCTACHDDFFSYRRVRRAGESATGRNGSVIVL